MPPQPDHMLAWWLDEMAFRQLGDRSSMERLQFRQTCTIWEKDDSDLV
jgi:hypothetical protein